MQELIANVVVWRQANISNTSILFQPSNNLVLVYLIDEARRTQIKGGDDFDTDCKIEHLKEKLHARSGKISQLEYQLTERSRKAIQLEGQLGQWSAENSRLKDQLDENSQLKDQLDERSAKVSQLEDKLY